MDDDIIVTLKRSNDLLMTFGNDYSDVFLPAIDEIERLREALKLVVVYHDGFTLTIEEVVATAREALKEKE